jgi:hypothetical protein
MGTAIFLANWFFESEFETLSNVVTILGLGEGGNFLDRCHREIGELVKSGLDMFGSPPAWPQYFSSDTWERLGAKGVGEVHLNSLYHAFRGFWMYALGLVGSVDTIHLTPTGGEPRSRRIGGASVRGERQYESPDADQEAVAGGVAPHPPERPLYLPRRRTAHRPGCDRGGAGVGREAQ